MPFLFFSLGSPLFLLIIYLWHVDVTYRNKLIRVASYLLEKVADAEYVGSWVVSVWGNSLYKECNPVTDPYTKSSNGMGSFYEDVNDALDSLFSDPDFSDRIDSLMVSPTGVYSRMKRINHPPKKYREAYSELKVLCAKYLELKDIVISPSGDFLTFFANYKEADNAVLNSCDKIILYLNLN